MHSRRPLFVCFFALTAFLNVASFCFAKSDHAAISACGVGTIIDQNISRARAEAVKEAQRSAVEMGLGTLIDSETIVKNGTLLNDRIYSQSSGYIADYSITFEGAIQKQTAYKVCLQANVRLTGIENDVKALGILKQHVNPRFMTLYVPRGSGALIRGCGAVTAAEQAVNEIFSRKGFIVLDRNIVWELQNEVDWAEGPLMSLKTLSAMAFKKSAEILLVLQVASIKRTEFTNQYFGEIRLEVGLQVVEPGTAEIITSLRDSTNVRLLRTAMASAADNSIIVDGAGQLASRLAERALMQTIASLGTRVQNGDRYFCKFWDFDQDEIFAIVGIIENLEGFKGMDVRNQGLESFEIEVQYLGKRFAFQRELYEALNKRGIHVRFQESTGNTLHLTKKYK